MTIVLKMVATIAITLSQLSLFSQGESKIRKNFTITLQKPLTDSVFYFDRKNPNKHGWEPMKEELEKSFTAKGFKVASKMENATYVMTFDYDYGYVISRYRMQYKNLTGSILDVKNNSEVIGKLSYDGKFDHDKLPDGIASMIVIEPNKNKTVTNPPTNTNKTKLERLTELKEFLDKQLISEADYEKQKQKILDE